MGILALKELGRELNVSAGIMIHWLKYGVHEWDESFSRLKTLFPDLESTEDEVKGIYESIYIEPPMSVNPHTWYQKNTFDEEDFDKREFCDEIERIWHDGGEGIPF